MSELQERIATIPWVLDATYLGLVEEKGLRGIYLTDEWRIVLGLNGKSVEIPYKVGIGHRVLASNVTHERGGYYNHTTSRFYTEKEACVKNMLKLQTPPVADVLACLLTDAQGADQSFEDWCSDFGFDTDSRRYLEIYLACQKTRTSLIAMLGTALFEELSQLEH